jgi:hypothetical protein
MVEKYKNSFSEEKWGIDNFMYPLPLKTEMSLVSFNDDEYVNGYCIASLKIGLFPYIHRFVGITQHQKNITHDLLEAFIKKYSSIYLLVAKVNIPGIKFYSKHGFSVVTNNSELDTIFPLLFGNNTNQFAILTDKYLMHRH